MAAAGEIQALCEEATCSICLDYFTDPVTVVECGHNFCQACLAQSWGETHVDASCPQCRKPIQWKNLIPNRQLKNMVEIAKKLRLRGQEETREKERFCEKHQEPLKLFCRDHDGPICVVCDKSKEHENHKVVPQEEAFQEYKDQICSRLKILRAEREKVLAYKADAEKESQVLLNQTREERKKTMAEFRQMHQFLEEQEKSLLAQIREVEKEVARRRDEHLARLCRELSSLENVLEEMEEKNRQPASEFLQDVKRTLQRYEEKEAFQNHVAFPPELTCRVRELSDRKPLLESVVKQFQAVGAPLKPPSLYRAGANQLVPDAGAPDAQRSASKRCLKACFSFAGSMAQPAFGSSNTQAPIGGSGPLASFGAKSITTQPAFGVTTSNFSFGTTSSVIGGSDPFQFTFSMPNSSPLGTATSSAVSGFGVTTERTSSRDGGAVIGGSAPFQFNFKMPNQPVAAGGAFGLSSAGSGSLVQDRAAGAAPPFGSSSTKPTLGSSQNQVTSFTFSMPGTTPAGDPALGRTPKPTFGQSLPAPRGGNTGNPFSFGDPSSPAFGGAGATLGSTTSTFCIRAGSRKGSLVQRHVRK